MTHMEQAEGRVIIVGSTGSMARASRLGRLFGLDMLVMLAGAFAAASARSDVLDDPVLHLADISATPALLPREQDRTYAESRHFQIGNKAQYRQAQRNLSSLHNAAAKWRSGAVHARCRSHENRHAERQRNWAAYYR